GALLHARAKAAHLGAVVSRLVEQAPHGPHGDLHAFRDLPKGPGEFEVAVQMNHAKVCSRRETGCLSLAPSTSTSALRISSPTANCPKRGYRVDGCRRRSGGAAERSVSTRSASSMSAQRASGSHPYC